MVRTKKEQNLTVSQSRTVVVRVLGSGTVAFGGSVNIFLSTLCIPTLTGGPRKDL